MTVAGITLYRTVRANPPTEADFLSHKARGLPRRGGAVEQWEGVSTFDNPTIAADMARRFNRGMYLARLNLDSSGPIRWAKTRGEGHYTIWGTPAELLACVSEVVPLDAAEGEAR
jgi:hypothetical protein